MALIDPLHPLQSAVLETLSAHHPLKLSELHEKLGKEQRLAVSSQNLYRLVAQLLAAQVLVRDSGAISLNQVWVSHVLAFASRVRRSYAKIEPVTSRLPLKDGEAREYNAGSLVQLDPIWSDILVAMAASSKRKEIFAYNSHPWYAIGMRETEQRFLAGLIATGVRVNLLYGNEGFLDAYGQRLLKIPGLHTLCHAEHELPRNGLAIWGVGPYVLEVRFPPAIDRQFEFFFQTVNSVDQLDIELFSNVFRLKARCRLKVVRDARRAAQLRRTLTRLFALPIRTSNKSWT